MPDMRKTFLGLALLGLLAITACGVGVRPVPTLSHDFTTSTPDAGYPTAMPTFTPTPAALGSLKTPCHCAGGSFPLGRAAISFQRSGLTARRASPNDRRRSVLQHVSRARIRLAAPASAVRLAATGRIPARIAKRACHSAARKQPPGCHRLWSAIPGAQ